MAECRLVSAGLRRSNIYVSHGVAWFGLGVLGVARGDRGRAVLHLKFFDYL